MREFIVALISLCTTLVIDFGVFKLLCFCFDIASSWKWFIGFLLIISIINGLKSGIK